MDSQEILILLTLPSDNLPKLSISLSLEEEIAKVHNNNQGQKAKNDLHVGIAAHN